ncbi:unnamed protein product, partial [Meganyctiphanes norvegica]
MLNKTPRNNQSEESNSNSCSVGPRRGYRKTSTSGHGGGGVNAGENHDNDDDGEIRQVPDGGWGWVVVIGSTMVTCLTCMVGPCFGILYSESLAEMGATSSVVAWIFNIYQLIINLTGLMIGPLKEEIGFRKISIFGSLIASVCIMASSLANSPLTLLITFSILSGIGVGLAVNVGYIITPFYFDRHLGIANAFTMGGVCSGQFIGPPLIGHLINQYSSKGAALIFGGLVLNAAAMSAVFHPVEWHMKTKEEIENKECEEQSNENQKGKLIESLSSISLDSKVEEPDWTAIVEMAKNKRIIQARRKSISFVKSYTHISFTHSNIDLGGLSAVASFAAMPQVLNEERMEQEEFYLTSTPPNKSRGFIHILIRLIKATIKNLRILKSPRGIIIAFGSSCVINGFHNFMMMIPFALQAQGHELETAAWVLYIAGITNFITRLILSLLSGYPWFHKRICYMAGSLIVSISIIC